MFSEPGNTPYRQIAPSKKASSAGWIAKRGTNGQPRKNNTMIHFPFMRIYNCKCPAPAPRATPFTVHAPFAQQDAHKPARPAPPLQGIKKTGHIRPFSFSIPFRTKRGYSSSGAFSSTAISPKRASYSRRLWIRVSVKAFGRTGRHGDTLQHVGGDDALHTRLGREIGQADAKGNQHVILRVTNLKGIRVGGAHFLGMHVQAHLLFFGHDGSPRLKVSDRVPDIPARCLSDTRKPCRRKSTEPLQKRIRDRQGAFLHLYSFTQENPLPRTFSVFSMMTNACLSCRKMSSSNSRI